MDETQGMGQPPGSTRSERLFARIAVLQTFISVMALLVAIAALYAALVESAAVRKQLDASVWPHMLLGPSNAGSTPDNPRLTLVAVNSGIGPAKIRSLRITVDGKPMTTWAEMFRALEIDLPRGYVQSQLTWRVVQSGERIDVLTVEGEPATALLQATNRVAWQLCYCSVFDDCHLLESGKPEPAPVARCPARDAGSFVQ